MTWAGDWLAQLHRMRRTLELSTEPFMTAELAPLFDDTHPERERVARWLDEMERTRPATHRELVAFIDHLRPMIEESRKLLAQIEALEKRIGIAARAGTSSRGGGTN